MGLIHVNNENFEKEVLESEKPVIIDFWAPWCGPCKMMGPIFEELSKEFEGKLVFAKLNTDEEQAIASYFKISGIPTLSIIHDKKEIGRLVGFSPKEVLKERIEEVLARIK